MTRVSQCRISLRAEHFYLNTADLRNLTVRLLHLADRRCEGIDCIHMPNDGINGVL
jgi:hypothetical protein